ncbi:MAG: radical SAM protein [Sedimentisphaerales bacterium]|jgi:wyosine [tRNA(Phe)-imidazoG37] synthetase (radical SAM superfamily)
MAGEKKYFYGPVPSRRLGRSYGVDIVPFKVCTLDCVYCQLGKTTDKTIERKDYGPIEPILAELRETLAEGLEADFITIAGSGEPTLNSRLGELIDGIKKISDIPVAILTNGTLLYKEDVRADCAKADVVMPSLDAGDEKTFQRINRPHKDISIENLISGLCAFRDEFADRIWLEVFFVEGLNTDTEQISKIRDAIGLIRPDKIQLNTAVRPTAEADIKRLDAEKLQAIAARLGPKCEVVADFSLSHHGRGLENKAEQVLSILKRRPCSLNDICSGLGIGRNEALKYVTSLQHKGIIHSEKKDGRIFFKVN